MVRSRLARIIPVGFVAIALAVACSGAQSDLGPNDPEALVAAAGLTIDDLPGSEWSVLDRDFAQLYPAAEADATPIAIPAELEPCRFLAETLETPPTPPPSVASARGWAFFESSESGGGRTIFTSALVFTTEAAARQAFEENTHFDEFAAFDEFADEECWRVLAALQAGVDDGSALSVRRPRELDFDIRGVESQQVKTTLSSSAGVVATVTTTAQFRRGHVVASYRATESEGDALDHERLISAFIQRVTDAQLADRALAGD